MTQQAISMATPIAEPHRTERRWWKHSIRLFGRWYITLSNCRVKKRPTCGYSINSHSQLAHNLRDIKGKMYEHNQHRCPLCGQQHELPAMELHHILPWSRYPELRASRHNMLLLCHACHKEIHCNPWRNIQLMEAKAQELGINLRERYAYGDTSEDYKMKIIQ